MDSTKYKVGEEVFDIKGLYRFAQGKGYDHAKGPYHIGQWLFQIKDLKLYENVSGKAVPVGWQR